MKSIKEIPAVGEEFICAWYTPHMKLDTNVFLVTEDDILCLNVEGAGFVKIDEGDVYPWDKKYDVDYVMLVKGEVDEAI